MRSILSTAIAIAVALSGLAPALRGQAKTADSLPPRFTLGSTHTMAGYLRFSSGGLDSRMIAAGLPPVAAAAATIGIGADLRRGRLLVGAGFQTLVNRDRSDAQYRTRLSGSYTLLDVGLAAVRTAAWSVYPLAGIGVTRLSVNVKELGDFSFDDALSRPARELGLSGTSALAHAGVQAERRLRKGASEYAISLRLGVTRSVGSQLWMSDASRVNGGPSGVSGTYLRVALSRPVRRRRDAALPIAGTIVQAVVR